MGKWESILIKDSSKILCPKCNAVIAVADGDITEGQLLGPDNLKFHPESDGYEMGDVIKCHFCKSDDLMKDGALYIQEPNNVCL